MNTCWKCKKDIPQAIQLNTLDMIHPPMPGDVSICRNCGAFAVFDGLLRLRKPSKPEMYTLENNEQLQQARRQLLGL